MSLNFRSRNVSIAGLFIAVALGAAASVGCTAANIVPYPDAGTGGGGGLGGQSGTGGTPGTGGTTTIGTGGHGTGGSGTGGMAGTAGMGVGGTAGSGAGGRGTGGAGGMGTGGTAVGGAAGTTDGGTDLQIGQTPSAEGDVVITEIMADSNIAADDVGEWFEIYNPSATVTFDLKGCNIFDSSNSNHDEITAHVVISPHAFVTLARFGTTAGGFMPTYNYHPDTTSTTDVKFGNDGDWIILNCGNLIDEVNFKTWLSSDAAGGMVPKGRSFSLDPMHYNSVDNDSPSYWCTGTSPFAASDFGTPNRTNPACACSVAGGVAGGCAWP